MTLRLLAALALACVTAALPTKAHSMEFPSDIIAAAQAAQQKWHVPASVTLAQWVLESSCGKKEPIGSYNCFGIKAVPGQAYVTSWTHETLNGVYQAIPQHFASYSSMQEAFDAHGRLLATSPYYVKAQHERDPDRFAMDLQGIYATGIPGHPYGQTLISIMRAGNLYRYDGPEVAAPAVASSHGPLVVGDIAGLQRALHQLGDSVTIDGKLGLETKAAILAFQRHFSWLIQDGVAGQATVDEINRQLSRQASTYDQPTLPADVGVSH